MSRDLVPFEIETLRVLNGEEVSGYVSGAASVSAASALKHAGLAEGFYTISQKGRDYLAALDAMMEARK